MYSGVFIIHHIRFSEIDTCDMLYSGRRLITLNETNSGLVSCWAY